MVESQLSQSTGMTRHNQPTHVVHQPQPREHVNTRPISGAFHEYHGFFPPEGCPCCDGHRFGFPGGVHSLDILVLQKKFENLSRPSFRHIGDKIDAGTFYPAINGLSVVEVVNELPLSHIMSPLYVAVRQINRNALRRGMRYPSKFRVVLKS